MGPKFLLDTSVRFLGTMHKPEVSWRASRSVLVAQQRDPEFLGVSSRVLELFWYEYREFSIGKFCDSSRGVVSI